MEWYSEDRLRFLKKKAYELRQEVIRMIYSSDISSGHFGGSLSVCEIITALYWEIMNIDPGNPQKEDRDRFVLSKGHSVPALYSALAHKGYFSRELLKTYRDKNSILQGHPDARKTPGLDSSSGSLGQGLSIGLGIALSNTVQKRDCRTFVLLSDGEMQEGMVWEAAMAASHYHVNTLTAFIDQNNLQVDGNVSDIMNIEPLDNKFRSFGWNALEIDGHDILQILSAFETTRTSKKPTAIICHTKKGKGVGYMEDNIEWHCTSIDEEQYTSAINELRDFELQI